MANAINVDSNKNTDERVKSGRSINNLNGGDFSKPVTVASAHLPVTSNMRPNTSLVDPEITGCAFNDLYELNASVKINRRITLAKLGIAIDDSHVRVANVERRNFN
jgi:hypothetical protein